MFVGESVWNKKGKENSYDNGNNSILAFEDQKK